MSPFPESVVFHICLPAFFSFLPYRPLYLEFSGCWFSMLYPAILIIITHHYRGHHHHHSPHHYQSSPLSASTTTSTTTIVCLLLMKSKKKKMWDKPLNINQTIWVMWSSAVRGVAPWPSLGSYQVSLKGQRVPVDHRTDVLGLWSGGSGQRRKRCDVLDVWGLRKVED